VLTVCACAKVVLDCAFDWDAAIAIVSVLSLVFRFLFPFDLSLPKDPFPITLSSTDNLLERQT
jgi:hypothetical protein